LEKKEPLLDETGKPIPQLDKNIKPDYKEHPFAFFPQEHRLIFETKIRPNAMLKLIQGLVNNINFSDTVTLILEQVRETIELIKGLRSIEKLNIQVSLPNGDSFRETIMKKIEDTKNRNIHKTSFQYTSIPKTGIVLDDDTIDWIDLSASYGSTTATGKMLDNKKKTISTMNKPLTEKVEITLGSFLLTAKEFLLKIVNRLK
jgi:hypothetical protein